MTIINFLNLLHDELRIEETRMTGYFEEKAMSNVLVY